MFKLGAPDGSVVLLQTLDLSTKEVMLTGYDDEGNPCSLFGSPGLYTFELVWYSSTGKLTSAPGWLNVSQRQVHVENPVVEAHLPMFDDVVRYQPIATVTNGVLYVQ